MSRYLLDTNICVALIRGRAAAAFERLRQCRVDDAAISSITLAELQFGVANSARPEHNALLLVKFCAPLAILSFDDRAAEAYGPIRADLERRGVSIGPLDTLIASHAMSLGLTVVTNNLREFRRVPGLIVENWLTP